VERYGNDSRVFFKEFSDVVCKLFELGVPFTEQERVTLKPTE
jgi:cytochrome c peroxidase